MNQHITVPSGAVHVEWIDRPCAIVRTWDAPGPLHAATGQPVNRWQWACVIVPEGPDLEIKAMHEMPVWPSFAELQQAMASLGFQRFVWEHWDSSGPRRRNLSLPPSSLAVQDFPAKATGETTHPTATTAPSATPTQTPNNTMTLTNKLELKNDETGKVEADNITNIYNLGGAEAAATAADIITTAAAKLAQFDAQTGEPA